ncbi:hypothetical protein [Pyrococcus kukulkanii]|uniref:Transposase n=1 Tax=Pyrococcus kukulkanii TaxID=1609559 RepID=A0ABV4T5Q5_9EURY
MIELLLASQLSEAAMKEQLQKPNTKETPHDRGLTKNFAPYIKSGSQRKGLRK